MFYTYLLRCEDHSLYAGITPDPARRFAQHCGKLSGGVPLPEEYTRVPIESDGTVPLPSDKQDK